MQTKNLPDAAIIWKAVKQQLNIYDYENLQ